MLVSVRLTTYIYTACDKFASRDGNHVYPAAGKFCSRKRNHVYPTGHQLGSRNRNVDAAGDRFGSRNWNHACPAGDKFGSRNRSHVYPVGDRFGSRNRNHDDPQGINLFPETGTTFIQRGRFGSRNGRHETRLSRVGLIWFPKQEPCPFDRAFSLVPSIALSCHRIWGGRSRRFSL